MNGGRMSGLRKIPDAIGTVVLLFGAYVVVMSLKDAWRYVKISLM
jgi:hypothetical protein